MAVYVDALLQWASTGTFAKGSCHMFADTDEELHAFAERLGLKRAWFQPHRLGNHYDLVPSKRALAVKLGAIEESAKDSVMRRRKARGEMPS